MRILLLVLSFYIAETASVKKRPSDSSNHVENVSKEPKQQLLTNTTPTPAIIAIEIVDAPKNGSAKGKNNSKRTIESALGYGYQNPHDSQQQKRIVFYKYSQQDIPSPSYYHQGNSYNNEIDIQKSVEKLVGTTNNYDVQPAIEVKPPKPEYGAAANNAYYNPSNLVYTTLSNQGQLGGLSHQIPYQGVGHTRVVPVIFLRVFSDQLVNPQAALHTNLPQANPYAKLNNVNLQSLLQNYLQQYLQSQIPTAPYQHVNYQQVYQPQANYYNGQVNHQANLPTYENYPSEQHTRVVFHSNNNGHVPVASSLYKTPGLSTYRTVTIPKYVAPLPSNQYDYTYEPQQTSQPQYVYYYPTKAAQNVYYQQAEQQSEPQEPQYQIPLNSYSNHGAAPEQSNNVEQNQPNYEDESGEGNKLQVEPETEEQTSAPYNYHAHAGVVSKHRRSQLHPVDLPLPSAPKQKETKSA